MTSPSKLNAQVFKDRKKDTFRRFHQRFTHAFFVRKSFWQLFSCYVLAKKALSYEKRASKMLMKLTPDRDKSGDHCTELTL